MLLQLSALHGRGGVGNVPRNLLRVAGPVVQRKIGKVVALEKGDVILVGLRGGRRPGQRERRLTRNAEKVGQCLRAKLHVDVERSARSVGVERRIDEGVEHAGAHGEIVGPYVEGEKIAGGLHEDVVEQDKHVKGACVGRRRRVAFEIDHPFEIAGHQHQAGREGEVLFLQLGRSLFLDGNAIVQKALSQRAPTQRNDAREDGEIALVGLLSHQVDAAKRSAAELVRSFGFFHHPSAVVEAEHFELVFGVEGQAKVCRKREFADAVFVCRKAGRCHVLGHLVGREFAQSHVGHAAVNVAQVALEQGERRVQSVHNLFHRHGGEIAIVLCGRHLLGHGFVASRLSKTHGHGQLERLELNGLHDASGLSPNSVQRRVVVFVRIDVDVVCLAAAGRRKRSSCRGADLTDGRCGRGGSSSCCGCRRCCRIEDERLVLDERAIRRFKDVGRLEGTRAKAAATPGVSVKHGGRCGAFLTNVGLVGGNSRVVGDVGSGKVMGVGREIAVVKAQAAHQETADRKKLPGKGKLNGGLVGLHPPFQHYDVFFGQPALYAELAFVVFVVVVAAAGALSSSLALLPRRRWHGRSSSS